jgi:polynucleotide 5'-kinase involved in rRNA processing
MTTCITVGRNSTVRVYGPAKLVVEAGDLLGPGYYITEGEELVVRSTRGTSLIVRDDARICYTTGSTGSVMVYRGVAIHESWMKIVEELESRGVRRIVVLGEPETGKSTMSLWLRNRLKLCLVEGDVGQNELGLPGMIAASKYDGKPYPVINDLVVSKAWFVGHVSAERVTDLIISATLRAARFCGDYVLDTDGYLGGKGLLYKLGLVSALEPDAAVVMGGHYISSALKAVVDVVVNAPRPPILRERDRVDRRAYRERAYANLFSATEPRVFDLNSIRLLNHEECSTTRMQLDGRSVYVLECPSGQYLLSHIPGLKLGKPSLRRGWDRGLLVGVDDGSGGEIPALLESLDYLRERVVVRVPKSFNVPSKPRYMILGYVRLADDLREAEKLDPTPYPRAIVRSVAAGRAAASR